MPIGLRHKFDLLEVASTIGAAEAASSVDAALGGENFSQTEPVVSGTVNAIVGTVSYDILDKQRIEVTTMAAELAGNVVGSTIVEKSGMSSFVSRMEYQAKAGQLSLARQQYRSSLSWYYQKKSFNAAVANSGETTVS